MRIASTRRLLAPVVLILFAAGCGDTPTDPPPEPQPAVSFSYSGERTGSFRAEGSVPLDAQRRPQHGTWAVAVLDSDGDIGVTASSAKTSPRADLLVLALHNVTEPGTYSLQPQSDCHNTTPTSCTTGFLGIDYSYQPGEATDVSYYLESGTVTVTTIGADRIEGTFEGRAGTRASEDLPLVITAGEFDVPIVPDVTSIQSSRLLPSEPLLPVR